MVCRREQYASIKRIWGIPLTERSDKLRKQAKKKKTPVK